MARSRPMRRVPRPWPLLAVGLACTLAACTPATTPTPQASSSAGSSATVSLKLPVDAPQTYEEASASANALMLTLEELPGGSWEKGGPVEEDTFRQTVCGVDTEPHPPAGSFVARRTRSGGATVLFQTIRPVGATQARATLAALAQAVPTCSADRRTKADGVHDYTMAPVSLTSADVVAYRQQPAGATASPIASYLVYFVARDSLVVFTTFGPANQAPVTFLDNLVAAVRRKA